MPISSDEIRGHTETIILARLMEGDSYGYEISKAVKELSQGRYELKEATLYSAFRRMETDWLIESYWGESEGGARRRYYHITEKGRQAHASGLESWRETKSIIDRLLCREGEHDV